MTRSKPILALMATDALSMSVGCFVKKIGGNQEIAMVLLIY